jgi:hypothetical protein
MKDFEDSVLRPLVVEGRKERVAVVLTWVLGKLRELQRPDSVRLFKSGKDKPSVCTCLNVACPFHGLSYECSRQYVSVSTEGHCLPWERLVTQIVAIDDEVAKLKGGEA